MIWLILGCAEPALVCPDGFRADPARAAALGDRRICFGEVQPSVIDEAGVIYLDASLSDAAASAKVAHLKHHRGFSPPPGEGCLAAWIRREAEAYDVETQHRIRNGLPRLYGYPWSLDQPATDRIAAIEAFLTAHPEGTEHIDGLVAAYTARCGGVP